MMLYRKRSYLRELFHVFVSTRNCNHFCEVFFTFALDVHTVFVYHFYIIFLRYQIYKIEKEIHSKLFHFFKTFGGQTVQVVRMIHFLFGFSLTLRGVVVFSKFFNWNAE